MIGGEFQSDNKLDGLGLNLKSAEQPLAMSQGFLGSRLVGVW